MSFAQDQIEAIQEKLSRNIGVDTITVDGQTVKFNRDQLLKELQYWKAVAGRESGSRPLFRGVDLGSAWNSQTDGDTDNDDIGIS